MLRTHKAVEDGIQKVVREGELHLVEYCPGNGYRYPLLFTALAGLGEPGAYVLGCVQGSFLVTLLDWPGVQSPFGRSMVVAPPQSGGMLHHSYVREKLVPDLAEDHAIVLAEIIAYVVGRPAVSCDEVRKQRAEAERP